jgi:hypothetical protein
MPPNLEGYLCPFHDGVYMHDFGALSYGIAQSKGKLASEPRRPHFPYKKAGWHFVALRLIV